ncbi:hypothetical protein MASR2M16_25880 [Thauera terpenica]
MKGFEMTKSKTYIALSVGIFCVNCSALAKVDSLEANRLGKDLTCIGAEAGANSDGSIPVFSGKWLGKPPHVEYMPHVGQHPVDVYPEDKPLFQITAENFKNYADKLSDGQKAMFKRFPNTFRIPVYQSRRDFRYPEEVCEISKKNALEAELIDDGLGYSGYKGPVGFPIPKNAMEVLANMNFPYRAHSEEMIRDTADVASDGSVTWGRSFSKSFNLVTHPEYIGKPVGGYLPMPWVERYCQSVIEEV